MFNNKLEQCPKCKKIKAKNKPCKYCGSKQDALTIAVKKRVSFVNIYYTDEVDEYNSALGTELILTAEEYQTLKKLFD